MPPTFPHDPYGALRSRNFRFYLIGNIIASMGTQMQSVAIGWELYERTGKAMALGLVGLVQILPILAFTLIAGHVADRYDRRRVIVAGQLLVAAASVGLALLSSRQGDIRLMYGCLFLIGTARAFVFPAKSSLLPTILSKEHFSNAVTWNSTGFELASIGGPAVGGVLIALIANPAVIYALNACAATLFAALTAAILVERVVVSRKGVDVSTLVAGFRYVWNTKPILASITLDMFAVLFGGATALLPIFAKDILRVGPAGLGWMLAAPSIGAFTMAFIQAHLPPKQNAGRSLLLTVAGFGAATIVFGLSSSYWLSLAMLFLTGVFDNVSVVIRMTLVQTLTPDDMRGRVSAVNSLFIGTSNELGGFESGTVAALLGPVFSVVSGGIGTLVVVAAVAAIWPQIRTLKKL
ncbi:MAG: MFS transporter [Blastocatellia bacterium]|nr:MFS transporter [Blastocatellia bacterium]